MNFAYGSAGVSDLEKEMRRLDDAHRPLGAAPDARRFMHDEAALSLQSDGGAVAGAGEDDEAILVLLGSLHEPAPQWSGDGAAADDPNAAARYLLERWKRCGRRFLDGVAGAYCVALIDKKSGDLLLASDPFGGRNWFIAEENGCLAFSSRVRALAASGAARAQLDRSYEDFLLVHGFYPFGKTPYKNVRAQDKGEIMIWRDGAAAKDAISASGLWPEMTARANSLQSVEEAVELVHDGFMAALRDQLPSGNKKIAVLLGGFDSALVAAGAHRLGYEVETYSFFYEDAQYNQPHADTLAEHLGIRHHWVKITREIVEAGLGDFAHTFNQPTNWPNYVIQTAYLCDRIRENGITHCYSGDGCDAVFLGYPGTYQRAQMVASLPRAPKALSRAMLALASIPFLEKNIGHPYRVGLGLLRGLGRSEAARTTLSFRAMDELTLKNLRAAAPEGGRAIDEIVEELSAPHAELELMRRAYLGKAMVSPNRNKLIGSADASGVAILSPYMHPGFKAVALSLPVDLMRPDGAQKSVTGKYILSRMAEEKGLLPPEIIHQKKMAAVDAPVDAWYAGAMRDFMTAQMRNLPFRINDRALQRLLDEKPAERWFRDRVMTDKVISHAASILATYASFTAPFRAPKETAQSEPGWRDTA